MIHSSASRIIIGSLLLLSLAPEAPAQVLQRDRSPTYWGLHIAGGGVALLGGALLGALAKDAAEPPLRQKIWEQAPDRYEDAQNRQTLGNGAFALGLVVPVATLVSNEDAGDRSKALFLYGEALAAGYVMDRIFELAKFDTRAPLAFSAAVASSLLFSEVSSAPQGVQLAHWATELGLATLNSTFAPQFCVASKADSSACAQRDGLHGLELVAGLSGVALGASVYWLSYSNGPRSSASHLGKGTAGLSLSGSW